MAKRKRKGRRGSFKSVKKRASRTRSKRRRGGSITKVVVQRRFSSMPRKSKGRRGRRGGGFIGRSRGGFLGAETLGAVGGAVAAGFAVPMLQRFLPANMRGAGIAGAAGAVLIGAVGFFLLRKFSRTAALGFAAASIGPAVFSLVGRRPAGGVAGWGESEGIDYLPSLAGDGYQLDQADQQLSEAEQLMGLGEYDPAYADGL